MLERLGQVLSVRKKRTHEQRLQSALAILDSGWSLEAFRDLQACADEGWADAQYELGKRYEEALGVVQNLGDAVHWYTLAANQSHVKAQSRLGLIYLSAPPPPAAVSSGALAGNANLQIGSTLGNAFEQGFSVKQDLKLALHWNLQAAQAGDASAQARLGQQHMLGLGTAADTAQGQAWLQQSVQQGSNDGLVAMGMLYSGMWSGDASLQDLPQAFTCFYQAAQRGHESAHFQLGLLLLRHPELGQAARSAPEQSPLYWLEKAAQVGHEEAMAQLGLAFWRGPLAGRHAGQAETWLRRASGRGHVQAMRWLGQLLLEQPGNDGTEAANLIRLAADEGDGPAASLLGELYLKGHGVPIDITEAQKWLLRAGTGAKPKAMTALARLYTHHASDTQGHEKAAEWLRKAAAAGSLAAKFTLGSLYYQGKGVAKDFQQAAHWFNEAAQAGSTSAAFYLGLTCARPDSPLHDDCQALRWFKAAAQGGHAHALCNVAIFAMEGRGQKRNPTQAISLLEASAAQGNVHAAMMLAQWYVSGRGTAVNLPKAAELLAQAVQLGNTEAACLLVDGKSKGLDWSVNWLHVHQHLAHVLAAASSPRGQRQTPDGQVPLPMVHLALARMHQLCLIPTDDNADAVIFKHFQQAAQAGLPDAQCWMGQQSADFDAAVEWFDKAAQQHHTAALAAWTEKLDQQTNDDIRQAHEPRLFQHWLAHAEKGQVQAQREVAQWYLAGRGCKRNPQAAVQWLEMAAQQGDVASQRKLSQCHADGLGTRPNKALARWWSEQSAGVSPAAQQ